MNDRVVVDVEQHVARVMLNRADKQNALDRAMFEALSDAGRAIKARSDVRAVVLHADGDHFSSGIDVSLFSDSGVDPAMLNALPDSIANFFQHPAWVWREIAVPVICVVRGNTLGGGLQIALGADIRIAAPDARLSIMEIKWGLIPDLAITATLRNIMPLDRVKALTFSGRILTGLEAERAGLVTQVEDDPLSAALALAKDIAERSPDAIRSAKRLIDEGFGLPRAESLRLEAELQRKVLSGPNQREAVRAQLEKRTPRFTDPDV